MIIIAITQHGQLLLNFTSDTAIQHVLKTTKLLLLGCATAHLLISKFDNQTKFINRKIRSP